MSSDADRAHLIQKIVLLHSLNDTPEKPSEIRADVFLQQDASLPTRILSLERERAVVESFTFLAATSSDATKVVAACIEEGKEGNDLTIRVAVNNGGLEAVREHFRSMANILESVAQRKYKPNDEILYRFLGTAISLNRNRILARLQSKHARGKISFKKRKMLRPKILLGLYMVLNDLVKSGKTSQTTPGVELLLTRTKKLRDLLLELENLSTSEAQSKKGVGLLYGVVMLCHYVHRLGNLQTVLSKASALQPESRSFTIRLISKLSAYYRASDFLLQAAEKYTVFREMDIEIIKLTAPTIPVTELDDFTAQRIDYLSEKSKFRKALFRLRRETAAEMKEQICHEAATINTVHAEVQLLFYYEGRHSHHAPRVISSSKKACYLCNLFFKIHGKFLIPSSHGRLYEKWALPENTSPSIYREDMVKVTAEFTTAIEAALLKETNSSNKPYPNPWESMVFASVACSPARSKIESARQSMLSKERIRPSNPFITNHQDSMSSSGSRLSADFHKNSVSLRSAVSATSPAEDRIYETTNSTPAASQSPSILFIHKRLPNSEKRTSVSTLNSPVEDQIQESTNLTPVAPRSPSLLATHEQLQAPEKLTSPVSALNSSADDILLDQGKSIRTSLSSDSSDLTLKTPRIHLALSYDEATSKGQEENQPGQSPSTCYPVVIEWLRDNVMRREGAVLFYLQNLPAVDEAKVEFKGDFWPRELCLINGKDAISIQYNVEENVSS